jgi:hypothetical protein
VKESAFFSLRRIRSGTGSIYHKELVGEGDGRGSDGALGGDRAESRGSSLLDKGAAEHDYIYEGGRAGWRRKGEKEWVLGRWMMPQTDLRGCTGGRSTLKIPNGISPYKIES